MINKILHGDALEILKTIPNEVVNCCVTSPPYWGLRDYGVEGQLGLEKTPEEYVGKMVEIFREVRRVLRDDGTLWLNLGDSYCGSWGNYGGQRRGAGRQRQITNGSQVENPTYLGKENWRPPTTGVPGLKPKDLVGIPWLVAFALRADGWYLRQDIIWSKPNPMPESVTDRCTKAHEYIFLLSKSQKYYYDAEEILEDVSPNTHERISQNLADQIRSFRANGGSKTNGPMKAVIRTPKQQPAGHGIKNNDSFNNVCCLKVGKRNRRSVWTIATQPFKNAHFATFPPDLITPCMLAGCPEGGIVLDPFMGAGTTALVALKYDRKFIGIELNKKYIVMAEKRIEHLIEQGKLFTA